MRETTISIPQLVLIAATRGMLGAGIGLLLGGRMKADTRKAVGATLLGVGVLTTIPLAMQVFGGGRREAEGAKKRKDMAPDPLADLLGTSEGQPSPFYSGGSAA